MLCTLSSIEKPLHKENAVMPLPDIPARWLTALWLVGALFVSPGDTIAQFRHPGSHRDSNREAVLPVESLILPNPDSDSLDAHFYVQIAHSQLQFILDSADVYRAQYEITAALLTEDRQIIADQIRFGGVTDIGDRQQNLTADHTTEHFYFRMPPVDCTFYLELFDRETRRSVNTEIRMTPPSFAPVHLSDLYFIRAESASHITPDAIRPVYPVSRSETDSTMKAVLFISAEAAPDTISLHRTLVASNNQIIVDDTNRVTIASPGQPLLIHLPAQLDFGSYQIRLSLLDASTAQSRQRTFFVRWGESNVRLPDLELAVKSLIHVADQSTIEDVLTRSRKEQEQWLRQFWQSRNPTPAQKDNPLQKEYYRRVMTANRQFSSPGANRPGWKTDRGYVYIVYGPPTDVDRPRPGFGETERYEIWYYRNIQKRFVFQDKFGNSDYRLVQQE